MAKITSRLGMIPGSEQHVANKKPDVMKNTAKVANGSAYAPSLKRWGSTHVKYKEEGPRIHDHTQKFGTEQFRVTANSRSPPVTNRPPQKNLLLDGHTE